MLTKRIIPCLDVRNGRVVKGVNFEGLRDVDDPVALARFYNDSGAQRVRKQRRHPRSLAHRPRGQALRRSVRGAEHGCQARGRALPRLCARRA